MSLEVKVDSTCSFVTPISLFCFLVLEVKSNFLLKKFWRFDLIGFSTRPIQSSKSPLKIQFSYLAPPLLISHCHRMLRWIIINHFYIKDELLWKSWSICKVKNYNTNMLTTQIILAPSLKWLIIINCLTFVQFYFHFFIRLS